MSATTTLRIPLPGPTLVFIAALEAAGASAYAVGGCVRDGLRGVACDDIDLATSAHWTKTKHIALELGAKAIETGVAHGTLTVILDGVRMEVTTFRSDGAYEDHRHPDSVAFLDSIEADLARRDFTINAMAWHPLRGIVDPFGGRTDLAAETIRAVGNAKKRFSEDALRVLRGVRFAAQLGFSIEEETLFAMRSKKHLLSKVSAERTAKELEKLLCGAFAGKTLVDHTDIVAMAIPELLVCKGFDQRSRYHSFDVLEHTARVVDGVAPEPLLRWAAVLHDIGKPPVFFIDKEGYGHFYGHAAVSATIARDVMRRMKAPKRLSDDVVFLARHHDDAFEISPRGVKRALALCDGRVGLFRALLALKRADALAHAEGHRGGFDKANELEEILEGVIERGEAFDLGGLAVSGEDLGSAGLEGPAIGAALERALEAVIEERIANERSAILGYLGLAR